MNALGLLKTALGASEPGRSSGKILLAKDAGELTVLRMPYDLRNTNDLITGIFEDHGARTPEYESIRNDGTSSWIALKHGGMRTKVGYFEGRVVRIDKTVKTEKVVYIPKRGHVLRSRLRDVPEPGTPGVVEFDGLVYLEIPRTPFSRTLNMLVSKGHIPGVHRVAVEVVGNNTDALTARLFPGENPRITEKMLPDLAKRLEDLKTELKESAEKILDFCHIFEEHRAVCAYKLLDDE